MAGDRGCPDPLLLSKRLGRRQVVRQGTLTPSPAGSNPAVPARGSPSSGADFPDTAHDPLAQSAEQLPFKQWVRGSNPRRVTKKKDTHQRVLLFASRQLNRLSPIPKRKYMQGAPPILISFADGHCHMNCKIRLSPGTLAYPLRQIALLCCSNRISTIYPQKR